MGLCRAANLAAAFLQQRLHFHNPYNDETVEEYKQFATPRK